MCAVCVALHVRSLRDSPPFLVLFLLHSSLSLSTTPVDCLHRAQRLHSVTLLFSMSAALSMSASASASAAAASLSTRPQVIQLYRQLLKVSNDDTTQRRKKWTGRRESRQQQCSDRCSPRSLICCSLSASSLFLFASLLLLPSDGPLSPLSQSSRTGDPLVPSLFPFELLPLLARLHLVRAAACRDATR